MTKNKETGSGPKDPEEQKVLERLREHPESYFSYKKLDEKWQRCFMDFCCGKKTLPLLYDPFFKRIFHPDVHPHRLERFISSLLGKEVKIKGILPSEDVLLEGNSLLIMDIVVEFTDGSIATVEIQKIPYAFPAERISCYSADLLPRQYSRVKGRKKDKFTYKDMRPVYTIVIYEKTDKAFHQNAEYLHRGTFAFESGLEIRLLQEICLIALDRFRENTYPKVRSEQTGWLSLLATENLADAEKVIEEYPWLKSIYEEMAAYRSRPEEVLSMFSEALRELDKNTVQYMIEEQQKEIEEQQKEIESLRKQVAALEKANKQR